MLCKKAKNPQGKEVARNLFHHPLKISLPPPGRNPESAPGGTFPQLRISNTALRLLLFTCAPKYTQMTVHNMRLN